MNDKKITVGMSKDEREKILRKTIVKEIAKVHALGLPTTHGDDKGVYRLYPDGRKEYTKLYSKR